MHPHSFIFSKLLFSAGFLQFQGNFVTGQNNSKYWDCGPLSLMQKIDRKANSKMCSFFSNRSFYSPVSSYLAFECKRGWSWPCFDRDLFAFSFKCQLVSIKTTWFTQQKAVRSVSKQRHLQPHCHSKARSLSRQLWNKPGVLAWDREFQGRRSEERVFFGNVSFLSETCFVHPAKATFGYRQ